MIYDSFGATRVFNGAGSEIQAGPGGGGSCGGAGSNSDYSIDAEGILGSSLWGHMDNGGAVP